MSIIEVCPHLTTADLAVPKSGHLQLKLLTCYKACQKNPQKIRFKKKPNGSHHCNFSSACISYWYRLAMSLQGQCLKVKSVSKDYLPNCNRAN